MSGGRRIHGGELLRCGSGAVLLLVGLLGSAPTPAADWLDTDGQRIVFGAGSRVQLIENPASSPETLVTLDRPVTDGALFGRRLFLIEAGSRLIMLDLDAPASEPVPVELSPEPVGRLRMARIDNVLLVAEEGYGVRRLHIAAGAEALVTRRDETRGARLHEVTVGNNFFSPPGLIIEVGDFVRWTNLAGFHNTFSCNSGQTGCAGQDSTEIFISGPPANPPWVYTYQFQLVGPNPYICQSHATTMDGFVTVTAPPTSPPVVPDGTPGTPMLVSKLDPTAASLSIAWDTTSCSGAADHHILFGVGTRLPAAPGGLYFLQGGECSIGLISPHVWNDVPDPSLDSTNMLWYLVLADDGVATEGSWSEDSAGNERSSFGFNGSSARCGMTDKDLSNTCGSD